MKRSTESTNGSYNKMNKFDDLSAGTRFVIIQRTDDQQSMSTISPFVLDKAISHLVGQVHSIRKLRNGTVMVQTMQKKQADKLIKTKQLVTGINVVVTEHKSLNTSKGVITCFDLKHATEGEILTELKPQGVTEIKRMKRRMGPGIFVDSDSWLLTFNSTTPPETIKIGYFEKIRVRLFIPKPLQCYNCSMYGHTAKYCKKKPLCRNCTEPKTEHHKCTRIVCSNCYSIEHAAWEKSCPLYKEEEEIQTIKTKYKVPYREARKFYLEHRPPLTESFRDIVNKNRILNKLPVVVREDKDCNDAEMKEDKPPEPVVPPGIQ